MPPKGTKCPKCGYKIKKWAIECPKCRTSLLPKKTESEIAEQYLKSLKNGFP